MTVQKRLAFFLATLNNSKVFFVLYQRITGPLCPHASRDLNVRDPNVLGPKNPGT